MKKAINDQGFIKGGLITLCLIILANPYIKTLDILPDFIAYFILVRLLTDIAYKAPYFDELRTALRNLGIISIAKLAGMLVLTAWKQKNDRMDDAVTLFVFIFAAIEIYFAISAIINFFEAVGYLSERTSASALYAPFSTGRGGMMPVQQLRSLTCVFFVAKCIGAFIPEMLLLYQDPYSVGIHPRRYYPFVMMFFLVAVMVLGIIWLRVARKYIKHISNNFDAIRSGVDELVTPEKLALIASKQKLSRKKLALTYMTVAAFLNIELSLEEFREVNLLPSVIFAALIFFGYSLLVKGEGRHRLQQIASLIFIAAAAVKGIVQTSFLVSHQYSDFLSSGAAKSEYVLVITAAVLEFAALIFFSVVFAVSMSKYTDGLIRSRNHGAEDRGERERKRKLRIKSCIFAALSIITGGLKLARVIIDSTVNYEFVFVSEIAVDTVYYSDAPWLPTLITLVVIVFGSYAIHYFGSIKDEEDIKFSQDVNI